MRSVDDLTAAARIRDAAIEQFGEHGFSVGLRAIAAAAGVSAGLVIHHFGSKEGLRLACDEFIAETIRTTKTESVQTSDPATWFAQLAEIESFAPLMAYLVRSMQTGGDLGKTMWRTMIDNAEQYIEEGVRAGTIKPSPDPKARAKFLAMTGGGGFMLYIQLHDTPSDLRAVLHDYAQEMVLPALEVYTRGLMTDSTMYDAFTAQQQQGIPIVTSTEEKIDMTANSTAAIEVRGLTKNFGSVRALDGLDLTVSEGEVHGFLGPNGAGKSTTIRVLLGLVRANTGTVRMLGGDPWADAVDLHRQIAYVPGDVTLWPSLTGGETIDLLARMRGGIDEAQRTELIDRFALDPTKKARTYSKGNRQKVSLISAFSSKARLLLLDEPSSGLDPLMENVFQQCVGEARDRGATVLLSSHILAETEALCDRVTIIRAGKTVESGTLDSMRHLSRTSIKADMIGDPGDIGTIKGVADFSLDGSTLRAQVDGESLGEVIKRLGDAGVRSLISQPPTLEDLFLRHYDVGEDSAEKVNA